ncbi:MAG: 16S rRNA (cytosine(967)-C(5))-methyltransferase RsmB [Betaproteobacteria bacterium]
MPLNTTNASINPTRASGSNLCNTILLAAQLLDQVRLGTSLTQALAQAPSENRSAAQSLTFDALRYKPKILQALRPYLHKAIDPEVEDIFLIAISTLFLQTQNQYAPYTLVNETVKAADQSRKTKHAKGLINAVLRRLIENPQALQIDVIDAQYPSWWVKSLKKAYPNQFAPILETNLNPAKMFLRVNPHRVTLSAYRAELQSAGIGVLEIPKQWQDLAPLAIALEGSIPVHTLPGFQEGFVSVQDLGAQIAAQLIAPKDHEDVLDACSAPGGKACHLLELADINLDVLEISEERMVRVKENLSRLHLNANIIIGDAARASTWWTGKHYDAILADVPCSATGIIRRHPDILYLRRSADIVQLQELQRKITEELWGLLKPGGRMLFVTCSILPQEGEQQLEWFSNNLPDALRLDCLGQLLPNEWHDGFYYGMLQKKR